MYWRSSNHFSLPFSVGLDGKTSAFYRKKLESKICIWNQHIHWKIDSYCYQSNQTHPFFVIWSCWTRPRLCRDLFWLERNDGGDIKKETEEYFHIPLVHGRSLMSVWISVQFIIFIKNTTNHNLLIIKYLHFYICAISPSRITIFFGK